MLTFVSPKDRLLLRLLKPKVAAWRWFAKARGTAGGVVLRHEYLEQVLARQIQDYDLFCVTAGFEFADGVYKLKITTANDGAVDRECHSLMEVATVAAFKFKSWMGSEVASVPQFATAALNARGPSDFIEKYLELRRARKLDHLRRVWIMYLTTPRDTAHNQQAQINCIAGILFGNYGPAHASADVGKETSDELELLGIDKRQAYDDIFDLMRPLILKDLQLHRPHAFHLHTLCETEVELRRLLAGDIGFLRAKRASMGADQLDYMLGSELGL